MIVKTELIKKLKGYFDLNIYETKVWLALLSKGISSAGEIAEISSVPRSRTYDVLESLDKRGFVIQKLGKPVKYIAVRPEIVIEKLKNNTTKHAEEKIKTLSTLKDTTEYKELQELHKTGIEPIKNHELSTSIKGRSNLYLQMKAIMETASQTIHLTSSAFELTKKQKMFKDVFAKLKKRNVDIKVMIGDNEEEAKKLSKKLKIKIRSRPIHARFVIVDKTELIFTIKPTNVHEDFDYGVWINSPFFTNSLAYMFEMAWKNNQNE
ncbi:TrmB family transcriptional regulator [Candidatus Pacearchaeota archaeon]|nr:TrmB family transcriptional regulator [Candidatus Pacearchaeota archaeon]